MKKTVLLLLIGLVCSIATFAQVNTPSGLLIPDTLLKQNFNENPEPDMLTFPSGNDNDWINWDQDGIFNEVDYPQNWYWDYDLGDSANLITNYAMTSASYLSDNHPEYKNTNWLIISPIYIPDSSYSICWRSAPLQGPNFMDGYKVLVSTTGNLEADFTDTIFVAAETVDYLGSIYSLDINDYVYSAGYIHANGFTNPDYSYVAYDGGQPFFRCQLEPHVVNLSKYAGQLIYVAFLHDSQNDYTIQIDDIIISNSHASGTTEQEVFNSLEIYPNPAKTGAYINWDLQTEAPVHMQLVDMTGKVLFSKSFQENITGKWYLDLAPYQPGTYILHMQTQKGVSSRSILKY